MNDQILISIIVPVYNIEEYVPKCIESIINQTFANIEIILVDDGSADKSGIICDYYAQKDSRIHVIHKENGGLSDARNIGLDIARGDYIMFVDGDDYIDSTMTEKLYSLLAEKDADVAVCGRYDIRNGTNSVKSKGSFSGTCGGEDILKENIVIQYAVWNKLYKKKIFENLRFPVGKLYEDVFVFNDIFQKCKLVAGTTEALYYYQIRDNSIMQSAWNISHMDELEAYLHQCESYVSMGGYDQQAIRKLFIGLMHHMDARPVKIPERRKEYKQIVNKYQRMIRSLINNLFEAADTKDKIRMMFVYLDFYKGMQILAVMSKIYCRFKNCEL